MPTPHLADILEDWIKKDKWLKAHFKVYRRSRWPDFSGWPDILDETDYFVGMSCDGIGVALAIMDDHVYYKNNHNGPKFKFMAANKDFFDEVKKDLIDFHKTLFPPDVKCGGDLNGF